MRKEKPKLSKQDSEIGKLFISYSRYEYQERCFVSNPDLESVRSDLLVQFDPILTSYSYDETENLANTGERID